MAIRSPVVFPLWSINPDGTCACGAATCGRIGKHPAVAWGELVAGSAVPRPAPGAGVGMKTGAAPRGSGVFVVDLDGPDAFEAWAALGGGHDTFAVETARGAHLYYEHPGFPVKTSAGSLAKGVDIRGEGGFVVAAGSPHRSGHVYAVALDVDPAPAPAWLLEWLQAQAATVAQPTQAYPGDVTDPEELASRRATYARYLAHDAPARGPELRGRGDATLFQVVQRGAWDLALPVDDVLELIREHYDPRCSPMWGDELDERVQHKARDAKERSTRPRAEPLPSALKDGGPGPVPPPARPLDPSAGASLGEQRGGWDAIQAPPVYLVQGIIPAAKVVTFFAEGGSLKTWAMLSLAISVATGEPWLGRYVVGKGRALYLDWEDGPYEFHRRVRLLTGGRDVPDLWYLYAGPQIDKADLWVTLGRMVKEHSITFVGIDALGSAVAADVDENATVFAAGIKLAGIFTETGCSVGTVHHANKAGGMRGSSAVRDQSDVVFRFEPVSETDNTKRMRMICDKPGPQKKPPPVNVELSDKGLTTFEDETHATGRNAKTENDVRSALLLALVTPRKTAAALRAAVGGSSRKTDDAFASLVAEGEAVCLKAPAPPGSESGYQLDDDTRRLARVRACLGTSETYRSAAALGHAAQVKTRYVESFERRGLICGSGDGRILEVQR